MKNDFIDYGKLFGELNFKEGDTSRSVYSPAAYLSDLLQLIEDYFDPENENWKEKGFFARRPDAAEIALDKNNTYDTLSYLTIVNELLEKTITKDSGDHKKFPYEKVLNTETYPLNLPFNLQFKKSDYLLKQLNVSWEEILKAFTIREDYGKGANGKESLLMASEYMGWSDEDMVLYKDYQGRTEEQFIKEYGIKSKIYLIPDLEQEYSDETTPEGKNKILLEALEYIEVFLKCTGISEKELREIIYQNLNLKEGGEREQASKFWVNKGTSGGFPDIDEENNKIVWKQAGQSSTKGSVPYKWFEKVDRFIRIRKKSDISYTDLDHILRYLPDLLQFKDAVLFIPVIKNISKKTGLSIEEVMVFAYEVSVIGQGNDTVPADQFNRIYNSKSSGLYKKYIKPGSDYVAPSQFEGYDSLFSEEDILLDSSEDIRNHIVHALRLKEADFKKIVENVRDKVDVLPGQTSFFKKGSDLRSLTILYRFKLLSKVCELSITELLALFDIIATDPTIRNHNFFDIFASMEETKTGEEYYQYKSPYKIIFNDDRFENLWLLQICSALSTWMTENELNVYNLRFWVSGIEKDEKAAAKVKKEKLSFLNTLMNGYKPFFLQESHFKLPRFTSRDAKLILATVQSPDYQLVSSKDKRLVLKDQSLVKQAAYNAIIDLEMINKEEFEDLQLEEKMVNKIISNLIQKGYLSKDFHIVEENFPKDASQFSIDFDFSEYKEAVFNIIQQQVLVGLMKLDDQDVEVDLESVSTMDTLIYKSDLESLNLSEAETQALYDNLIFNQVINEEGKLLAPFMFTFEGALEAFVINTGLEPFSVQIYERLVKSMKEFEQSDLILSESAFTETGLKQNEITDLMENLIFNGYLTKKHKVVDKVGILKLTADEFLLALAFYPKRRSILKALQEQISDFKKTYFALDSTIIQSVANKIVAERAFNALKEEYFPDGPVKSSLQSFFLDEVNKPDFYVDPYFDASASDTVFDAISQVIQTSNQYLLNNGILEEIGLNQEEISILQSLLQEYGFITDFNAIPRDKLSYFLNVNSVVGFSLEGFEDYNKDVFAALHLVAKATEEAMTEITDVLKLLADAQNDMLFSLFQDHFGLSSDLIELIFKELYAEDDNLAHQMLLPLIDSVQQDKKGSIKEVKDAQFNIAYLRMRQLLSLFNKLEFGSRAAKVLMTDQDLVQKFSEKFALPKEFTGIDALLETNKDTYLLFSDAQYVEYSGVDYSMMDGIQGLDKLSGLLDPDLSINAAYRDEEGDEWIIQGELAIVREAGKESWEKREKKWGQIENNFSEPEQINFSFIDEKGRTFVFTGDQYARYSNGLPDMDAGYPKEIAGNWEKEDVEKSLPAEIVGSKGASILAKNGKRYVFKKDKYASSDDYTQFFDVNSYWGKVKNNFTNLEKIDAAFIRGSKAVVISGDQVLEYSNSLETEKLLVDAGSPKSIDAALLEKLGGKASAAFTDFAGKIHCFGKEKYLTVDANDGTGDASVINTRWGNNSNTLASNGTVDAALDGLDGKIYLFSGPHYYRYSTDDYSTVDPGYPKTIADDWEGLDRVDAATILDGKTYLFGTKGGNDAHVRFSTRDYNKPDENFSIKDSENWWNLPFALVEDGFNTPDAVFQDFNGDTHLFLADKFVTFDRLQRWWSEPQSLASKWDSLPFSNVDAAFIGKDGNTYLFSGKQFVRYSDKNYSKVDADFPKSTSDFFGKVDNVIDNENRVDAALSLRSRVKDENDKITEHRHVYLFAGHQYVRYTLVDGSDETPEYIDPGYPKLIAESLPDEPRFKGLTIDFDQPVDAAMADQRNVYVFQGKQMHIYSDELHHNYSSRLNNGEVPEFILKDDGATYYFANGIWNWVGALEHENVLSKRSLPKLAAKFPTDFIKEEDYDNTYQIRFPSDYADSLETVLQGADNNTYIFYEGNCYNVALEKSYKTEEAWGISSNNFILNNKVDAGFYGLDGKIHLFSDDQFVSYTIKEGGTKSIPQLADVNPGAVSEVWGGLSHVHLAYVNDGITYLMERPDENGTFRYVQYSSKDYSKPDKGFPKMADFSFWQIPESFADKGFSKVTAVHVEDDNFYLLDDNTFIQYNLTLEQWTPPMPAERVWVGLPINKTNLNIASFDNIKTLLSGPDNELIFFSEHSYVTYKLNQFGDILPIKDRWGIVHSEFISDSSKVDAAFVSDDKQTFLFSGLNYIRYSTADYRIVDPGYPKTITTNLRLEKGFENLPEGFDELVKNNGKIDAIFRNSRHHILFLGADMHIVSSSATASRTIDFLGLLRNNIQRNNIVDTAYNNKDGDLILFSGDQFYRYSGEDMTYVDEGYPKLIKEKLKEEENIHVPEGLEQGIDSVIVKSDRVVLVKGSKYASEDDPNNLSNINLLLGSKENAFKTITEGVDAAFLSPDGYFYVFEGNNYIRYEDSDSEFIDEGYPRPIKDNWGNMASLFEEGVDGAFVLDGVTYFIKGAEYIRYSDDSYQEMDPIYPQKIRDRWGDWNDIHLGDLKLATQFKGLIKKSGSKSESLMDFFDPDAPDRGDSFELLGKVFDWLPDEIKWLKRKNAFLTENSLFERNLNLELVLRMDEIFSLCKRLNRKPSAIYNKLWNRLYKDTSDYPRDFTEVAEVLSEILSSKKNKTEWEELKTQIYDYLNTIKRDAMLPYVIANDPDVENARDLLGKLLIDVEMGVEAKTSRIKELIAAAQLFMHRYFVQAEDFKIRKDDEEVAKADLREQWRWMKNYRVWEANRKVYLYPENYLRPELRGSRTPAFDTMVNELLQGDMNDDTISQIYKKYLDEYTEVSRLTIAGGFVYDSLTSTQEGEEKDKELILFGRTKTDPRRYYYRTATFFSDDSAIWNPWLEVNIKIDANKVYPVYAFGRIFVFWWVLEQEAVEPEKGSVKVRKSGSNTQSASSGGKNMRTVIRIYFSFYNLNKEWAPPQLMDTEIYEEGNVTEEFMEQWSEFFGDELPQDYDVTIYEKDIELFVQKRNTINDTDHENIYVACAYIAKSFSWNIKYDPTKAFTFNIKDSFDLEWIEFPTSKKKAYQLTPELYTVDSATDAFDGGEIDFFKHYFNEENISSRRVVKLNNTEQSPDTQWISFDHKGGSFLIRPDKASSDKPIKPTGLNLPSSALSWNRISAAFHLLNGNHFFSGEEYLAPGKSPVPISDVWGKSGGDSTGPVVDCAWFRDGMAYLISNGEKFSYTSQRYAKSMDHKEALSGQVPSAAFYNPNSTKLYEFFDDNTYKENGSSGVIKSKWGRKKVLKELGAGNYKMKRFASHGDHTFIFVGGHAPGEKYCHVPNDMIGNLGEVKWEQPTLESIATKLGVKKAALDEVVDSIQQWGGAPQGLKVIGINLSKENEGTLLLTALGFKKTMIIRVEQNGSEVKLSFSTDDVQPNTSDISRCTYLFNQSAIGFNRTGGGIQLDGTVVKSFPRILTGIVKDTSSGQYYVASFDEFKTLPVIQGETATAFIDRLAALIWDGAAPKPDELINLLGISNLTYTVIEELEIAKVDAAWYKDGKTYLSYGNQYVRYSGDNYESVDEHYPKSLNANNDNLPKWAKIDAAFTGADGKTYFFNNKKGIWVNSDNVSTDNQLISDWGPPVISIDLNRVDAAFGLKSNEVYLFKGNSIYKHTPGGSGNSFILEDGFPKSLGKPITAACVLDNYVYLFSHSEYKRLQMGPTDFSDPANYKEGWGSVSSGLTNIPPSFLPAFDAALNDLSANKIYIYKNKEKISYADENQRIKTVAEAGTKFIITRLTSGTGYKLNTVLFAGGLDEFLSLDTQFIDETPAFAVEKSKKEEKPNVISVKSTKAENLVTPVSSHLDFHSSNGIYYWEMFYYAPLIIAQTYNNLQKFEEAKRWYGFVFNPTQIGEYWRFVPFLNVDVASIIESIHSSISQLRELNDSDKIKSEIDAVEKAFAAKRKVEEEDVVPGIFDLLKSTQEDISKDNLYDSVPIEDYRSIKNLEDVRTVINKLPKNDKASVNKVIKREKEQLLEITYVLERLKSRLDNLFNTKAELRTYLDDPFDPHAIARLRKESYRKSVVMRYIDNLLDWGDMLFRQYTMESINEARMHYILAYDLLGQKPENVGRLLLPETQKYSSLVNTNPEYDFNLKVKEIANPNDGEYFYIPENDNFMDYWERVEDRLYKIRQSLNILGIKQALPLFQPPIDPMALVNAVAGGGGLAAALSAGHIKVPHYRFTFMLEQAKQLADKVNQFGNDLLSNLEKRDSEVLSLMQSNQEGEILELTTKVNQAQIEEAEFNLLSAEENLVEARARRDHYEILIDDGLLTHEEAQIGLMIATNVLNAASGVLKIGSALAFAFPKVDVGPFKMGIQVGGDMVANGLDKISEAIQGVAQVTSLTGEIIGVYASHERMKEDWRMQLKTAESNIVQFEHQIEAAKVQKAIAEYQMDILQKQIDHNRDISDYYRSKFTNQQLYNWMVSQLSSIYYQTYKNAYDLARSAEKAYQFERGIKERNATYIGGGYWDSQRKGLLAGDKLNMDLQRMEKAFYETDKRSFEIKKEISLFSIDPVALVKLKQNRNCEFSFTESLFNYDFQGHYRRQIKSVGLIFQAGDENLTNVNATLTQLSSKIIMEPDIKAVKYLINPQGEMPASIRGNWRSSQQLVLSQSDQYSGIDNGLFEMRFDDQRYLPFEGTGAISDWRLDLSGLREDFELEEITDVIITLNYTAHQGGELFGGEVKSTLKPYLSAQLIDIVTGFPDAWNNFLADENDELKLTLLPSMFPNIRGNKIDGILCKYELFEPGSIGLMLKEQDGQELTDGNLMATSGLKLPKSGATWTFTLNGDKANLKNIELILTYQSILK